MGLLDKIVYHRKSLVDPKSHYLALASRAPRRFWLSEPELQALCDSEKISPQPLSGLSESSVADGNKNSRKGRIKVDVLFIEPLSLDR